MNSTTPTTFMTGATGIVGHYIVRDLLERGRRVVALVRPPMDQSVARLTGLLGQIGVDCDAQQRSGRLVLVEGALPDALPKADWGATDDVIACAASLKLFKTSDGEPHRTNVDGTRAVIDWCRRNAVRRIHAVSTAYVCGSARDELIPEAFHIPQPVFRTDYEATKWQAEMLLRQWAEAPENVLTILRPSFVVGDSQTGYTTQFFGFYQLARLVSTLKQQYDGKPNNIPTEIPLRMPIPTAARPNLVPVDFATRIIAEVVTNPRWHGRIYHLTDPEPPPNRSYKGWFEEYYNLCGGHFVDPHEPLGDLTPAEALLWERVEQMAFRVSHSPRFSQRNTAEVMAAANIEFPVIDRDRVFRLLDFAAAHDWGRRLPSAMVSRSSSS